jgi:hypothetical protein
VVRCQGEEGQLGHRRLATKKQDYGWVAKVQDRVYGRQNDLIYGLLDSTGVIQVHIQFYGPLRSLQVFLGVVSAFCHCRRLRPAFAGTLALPALSP